MKRCEMCGGRFGLIIYRHFARRFCRKRCKDLYLARLRQQAHEPKDRWLTYLSGFTLSGPRVARTVSGRKHSPT
jgi:hypothetical protein